jgi:hypothetical protein
VKRKVKSFAGINSIILKNERLDTNKQGDLSLIRFSAATNRLSEALFRTVVGVKHHIDLVDHTVVC